MSEAPISTYNCLLTGEQGTMSIDKSTGQATKPCPICGEDVKVTAKKCIHCEERIDYSRRWWAGYGTNKTTGKTAWDFFGVLVVPLSLVMVAAVFSFLQAMQQDSAENSRFMAEEITETERAREAALQGYFDAMSGLLERRLDESEPGDTLRAIARARTLTTLRQLDGARKGLLVQFLYESGLVGRPGTGVRGETIVRLQRADLSEADLVNVNLSWGDFQWADLSQADLNGSSLFHAMLSGTNLQEANLANVDLSWANLTNANLMGADLTGANLRNATLTGAKVTDTQLTQVASLEGATMPDGTSYSGDPPLNP